MAYYAPLKVVLDGKPCSGKTTLAKIVAEQLNRGGESAIDVKEHAVWNSALGRLSVKFDEGEISELRDVIRSGAIHTLRYLAMELDALRLGDEYNVHIMQRSTYAFSFMLQAVMVESKRESFGPSKILYPIIGAWAKIAKPDIIFYLEADTSTLLERFEKRKDGRDR
ncbi:MAG: hypothetical protein QXN59_03070, partial [Candidatus Micrarchaeaceae archaeon]